MTVDNLVSADVVTADGRRLTPSDTENPDLFWGLRGGGGNFGVVTSFEYRVHDIPPAVFSGLIVYPLEDGPSVLRGWRDFVADQPEDLAVWAVLRKAPPLPFLPADRHGRAIVALAVFYGGDPEEGERLTEPLLHLGEPLGQHLGPQPYADWQTAFDPLLTPGARNYWKSQDFRGLTDAALDQAVRGAAAVPSPHSEVFIGQLGGAMSRVAPETTAYPHRTSTFVMNLHGRWERPEEDAAGRAWARDMFDSLTPHATGGVYVNFLSEDEAGRVRSAYGPNFDRLVALKDAYDPGNLFRMNMNVRPTKIAA